MKALKTCGRIAPASAASNLQTVLEWDWPRHARWLPKDFEVLGVLTIGRDDHVALIGAQEKVRGAEVTMTNQSWVRLKLGLVERLKHCQVLVMVVVN
jgi:hypothetical protein